MNFLGAQTFRPVQVPMPLIYKLKARGDSGEIIPSFSSVIVVVVLLS
jgi:hypothetical protein